MTVRPSRPHVVAPAELTALRDLELVTRTTVEGVRQGLHRSPFHGYSAEFSQYRHYRPGDDLKYVDWKAFGRTDRLYSRQFRETTSMGALFVVDVSRSMAFPEHGLSKFQLARAAAAALAALVIDQGDAAGLLAFGQDTVNLTYVTPRSGRHHLHVFLAALARLEPTGRSAVTTALRRVSGILRRRSLVVVLSDLYEEDEALGEIRRLARMGHDVVNVHVIAREELTLSKRGSTEYIDLESGARLVTSADIVAGEYEQSFQAFLARVQRATQREGVDYLRLVTDQPLQAVLRRFLVGRRLGS